MRDIVPAQEPESRHRRPTRAPKRPSTRGKRGRRVRRWLLVAALAFLLATWTPVLALRFIDPPATAFMLFNNRAPLDQTRHTWRDRAELGEESALAVMAAEDQNFPRHHGVDFDAIAKAVEDNERGGRLRGGSGITQQLAKNLFLWPGRSLVRKGLEAYLAVVIDLLLPKRRVLELYLNVVEIGPGIYGVPAASLHYFGVEPAALSPQQAALLAAVLPNPNRLRVERPSEYVRVRQAWIRDQADHLRTAGWLDQVGWRRD